MATKRNSARATSLKPSLSPSVHQHYFNFIKVLIIALPPLLFCSYYPIISLGASDSMNFELSLPLLWLPIFLIATLPYFPRAFKNFKLKTILLGAAFPLWSTISLLWSANPLRGLLTAGIYWLLTYAIFMLIYLLKSNSPLFEPQNSPQPKATKSSIKTAKSKLPHPAKIAKNSPSPLHFLKTFWQVFFISSLLICLFCWLQCILDIAGLDRSVTLLCEGCTYSMFGFPHPSGFAIEPQYMGNLLLAPALAALYFASRSPQKSRRRATAPCRQTPASCRQTPSESLSEPQSAFSRPVLIVLAFIFTATLFLTFSRGAIYAFVIALVILLIFAIWQHHFRPIILTVPITSFIFVLICQGIFATLSPTSDNFITATTKSIHQLSLGLIDLRPEEVKTESTTSETNQPSDTSKTESSATTSTEIATAEAPETAEQNSTKSTTSETSVFSGYVAGSTNTRLSLTSNALQIWSASPINFIFGTGLGSAGIVLYQNSLSSSPKEVVQNEYASQLLELGIIGLILLAAIIIFAFYQYLRPALKNQPPFLKTSQKQSQSLKVPQSSTALIIPLFTAYLITFCFFSGPANTLHIYLLPPLLFAILTPQKL